MGNRANVMISMDEKIDEGVFFYVHWAERNFPSVIKRALAKRWRWGDPIYLARIVFCEIVKGQEETETGFGISNQVHDNEHAIIEVNAFDQTVRFRVDDLGTHPGRVYKKWTFEEYVKTSDAELLHWWHFEGEGEE